MNGPKSSPNRTTIPGGVKKSSPKTVGTKTPPNNQGKVSTPVKKSAVEELKKRDAIIKKLTEKLTEHKTQLKDQGLELEDSRQQISDLQYDIDCKNEEIELKEEEIILKTDDVESLSTKIKKLEVAQEKTKQYFEETSKIHNATIAERDSVVKENIQLRSTLEEQKTQISQTETQNNQTESPQNTDVNIQQNQSKDLLIQDLEDQVSQMQKAISSSKLMLLGSTEQVEDLELQLQQVVASEARKEKEIQLLKSSLQRNQEQAKENSTENFENTNLNEQLQEAKQNISTLEQELEEERNYKEVQEHKINTLQQEKNLLTIAVNQHDVVEPQDQNNTSQELANLREQLHDQEEINSELEQKLAILQKNKETVQNELPKEESQTDQKDAPNLQPNKKTELELLQENKILELLQKVTDLENFIKERELIIEQFVTWNNMSEDERSALQLPPKPSEIVEEEKQEESSWFSFW